MTIFFKADRFDAEKLSTGNIKLLIRAFVILASVLVAHISQKSCQSRSGSGDITKVLACAILLCPIT